MNGILVVGILGGVSRRVLGEAIGKKEGFTVSDGLK
jgi:hypothetical protein